MSTLGLRRKRARVDTNTAASSMEVEVPVEPPTRDASYYFDDGDLIILAGNTLFRVHKFLLSRDSSMFKDMFIIPGGSSATERTDGSSDETPLLVSDTVDAFRALLWVLYALPPDLQAYLANDKTAVDLNRIVSVAETTNKYHFTSLEAWSMQVIKSVVPKLKFTEATSTLLARIMTLAERCADSELSDTVLAAWEGLLRSGVNPAQLINVLERQGHASFIPLTYHAQLSTMKLVHTGDPGSRTVTLTGCEGLSDKHISKLLFARWSLEKEFLRLSINPPHLVRSADCTMSNHSGICARDWEKIWHECVNSKTVLTIDSADILGRLNAAQKYIPTATSSVRRVQMHANCRPKMEFAVGVVIKITKRNLVDHFQVPVGYGGVP
ncbi:BTB domain-containing protein [Mycena venus]|uniref:BTB domain-containing protein n=1 Tax=Mycena venus TaxID=2733690 RepID=A0A8H6XSA1_9AGAR|nr:BTB domain-containing protein [Mycena venus]